MDVYRGETKTPDMLEVIPALASSTGVGLWRLSSSVCHIDVISLTCAIMHS
jgi:hypothetical protein